MGHERVGTLPRTKKWRDLVDDLQDAKDSEEIRSVAWRTLKNVQDRFAKLPNDPSLQAAFGVLIALSASHLPPGSGYSSININLETSPSLTRMAMLVSDWIRKANGSPEYATLASRACLDAISFWTQKQRKQGSLFGDKTAQDIWSAASSGAGFSEVSRAFFAGLTHRYLKYFIDREASSVADSIQNREEFSRKLESIIDSASQHAFETSKITQSFAAGWFNKNTKEVRPGNQKIRNFLRLALGKIKEELSREARNAS